MAEAGAAPAVSRVRSLLKRFAVSPGPVSIVSFIVYTVYTLSRNAQYFTAGYDLGIFATVVKAYAHFEAPIVPLKGMDYNILGDHFHPILAVLVPFWWVWPSPTMLLVAQAGLVAVSVLPVWWFTRRRLPLAATNAVAVAYVFSWMLQGLIDYDFHEIAFGVPILAFVIDLLDRRRYGWAVAAAAALLLVREDMAFIVLMVAVLLAVRHAWRWSAVCAAASVVGYVVAMVIVIPHFSPTGTYAYWSLSQFGSTPASAVRTIITHPWQTITTFVTPAIKARTLLMLFAPFAFLSLGSVYVLLALPILAQRFLSDREVYWGMQFQYSAILAPVLAMAAVDTLGRVVARWGGRRLITASFCVWALGFLVIGIARDSVVFPLRRVIDRTAFDVLPRATDLAAAIATVPTGVCVEADDRAVPPLMDGRIVVRPGGSDGEATWMVLDLSQQFVGTDLPSPQVAEAEAIGRGFVVRGVYGSVVVLERPGAVVSQRCANA